MRTSGFVPGNRRSRLLTACALALATMPSFGDEPAGAPAPISLVELPAPDLPGPTKRKHHALSFAAETPKLMLRSIGFEATECRTQLRMPLRLRPERPDGRPEAKLQLGVGCRF